MLRYPRCLITWLKSGKSIYVIFGKSAYIRSVFHATPWNIPGRFDLPNISMQWRVEWNFPELPEIGRSNELYPIVLVVVVLLFICFCFFYHNNTIPVYCVIRLAFEFIPWLFVEWFIFWKVNNSPGSQKNFFETFSSLRKFHNYGSYTGWVV